MVAEGEVTCKQAGEREAPAGTWEGNPENMWAGTVQGALEGSPPLFLSSTAQEGVPFPILLTNGMESPGDQMAAEGQAWPCSLSGK